MVQGGRPLQREFFNPRESSWHERSLFDISQDNRFSGTQPSQPTSIHPRCLPVEAALKDCAGLSVKEFALFVVDDNGDEKAYTSTSLTPHQQRIFTERFKADFRKSVQRASQTSYPHSGYVLDELDSEKDLRPKYPTSGESSSEGTRRFQRQSRSEDTDDDSTSGRFSRKRPRPQYNDNDDTPVPVPVTKTQQLMIGDEVEVEKFYNVRFKDMQQSSCKIMGKAFVKLIEPKKQTHHPYTKGAAKAPSWWPPTVGENQVRHKEPDHLLKPERIRLLIHILKMIVEPPEKQCPTVLKLGLNVKKLEEVTMEAMSNWFNDKDHAENAQKRIFLKEIFKVAKAQERYKNGEIDGTTRIPVQFGDRSAQDNSDDDDPDEGIKDEDEECDVIPGSNGIVTSDSMISASMIQPHHLQQENDFPRQRPIVVRYHTQPQAQIEEQTPYIDPYRNMNVNFQQMSPTVQDPNRRGFTPSTFQSPSPNLYPWQNNMVTNSSPSNFYVTSPQPSLPPQSIPYQLPPPQHSRPPMTQQHSYDGLPNGRYDSGPAVGGNQMRTGSLGNPHHVPTSFPDYLQDNSYVQNDPEMKHDQHMHPS